jgi:hypothetical protein
MANVQSIVIRKGTKVLCVSSKQLVELRGDAYVEASRHDDGGYGYRVGDACYLASAGTVEVL